MFGFNSRRLLDPATDATNPLSRMSQIMLPQPQGPEDIYSRGPMSENPQDSVATPENPLMAAYREIMAGQNGPARSAYSDFIQRGFPKEEDYKPSRGRRLAAALAGGAIGYSNPGLGIETGQNITSGPYQRAVRQYGMEGAKLKEAANLEETGNKNRIEAV